MRAIGSTPVSGSSSSRKSGSCAIAVASFVRWRMPFEKPLTRRCIASVMPICASALSAAALRAIARHAGELRHRGDQLERGQLVPRLLVLGRVADAARAPRRRRTGSRRTRVSAPRDGRSRPAIILISVDLPAPLGPSRPTMPPRERPADVGDAEHVAVPLAAAARRRRRSRRASDAAALRSRDTWYQTMRDREPRLREQPMIGASSSGIAVGPAAQDLERRTARTSRVLQRRSAGRAPRSGAVRATPSAAHDAADHDVVRGPQRERVAPVRRRAPRTRAAPPRTRASRAAPTSERLRQRAAGASISSSSRSESPSRSPASDERADEHDRRDEQRRARRACRARSRAAAPSARSRT